MCLISFSVLSIGHADTGYVVGLWCRFLLIIPYNDFGSFSACSAIICINVDLATPKKKKKKTFPSRYIIYGYKYMEILDLFADFPCRMRLTSGCKQ